MTIFPAANDISGAATEGILKQAHEDTLATVKQLPGAAAESALTIAVGSVTPTGAAHAIDTEAAVAADDLSHIDQTNLPDGSHIMIHSVDAARVVTVKHAAAGAGEILLTGAVDLVLNNINHRLLLERRDTKWYEISRVYGAAAPARANLGLVIGTDVLAPNGDGSGLFGIVSGATLAERADIALNGFLISSGQSLTGSSTVNGWRDVFTDATGIDAATSLNETYDAVNHLYSDGSAGFTADLIPTMTSNTTPSGVASASSEWNASYAAWKALNKVPADFWNSVNASDWISYQFATAKTITQYTLLANDPAQAGNAPGSWTFEGSNNGTTWTTLDTITGQTWTAPETKTFQFTNSTAYTYYRLNISANATSSNQVLIYGFAMMESLAPLNMTLVSNASTALSVPTSADIFLWQEDVDVSVPNTDYTAWASRDGGTTWTQITLAVNATLILGQTLSGSVDISAQPSGTAMKYKIETLNTKSLKIRGVQIGWS